MTTPKKYQIKKSLLTATILNHLVTHRILFFTRQYKRGAIVKQQKQTKKQKHHQATKKKHFRPAKKDTQYTDIDKR